MKADSPKEGVVTLLLIGAGPEDFARKLWQNNISGLLQTGGEEGVLQVVVGLKTRQEPVKGGHLKGGASQNGISQ